MLSKEEKKELLDRKKSLNLQIISLQKDLNAINQSKEDSFSKKEKVSESISSLIKQIRSSKSKRNKLTKSVQEVKVGRTEYNDQIKAKVEEIKLLNKQKKEIQTKHNIKSDPSFIKKDIDKLETKIETEALKI